MRRLATAVAPALLVALAATLAAQAPARPVVRASLDRAGKVTLGEPVSLVVEILVPTFFMSAPSLPSIDVPNAAATLEDASEHTTETIDGAQWAGIRRRYRIVAQAAGTIRIPPVNVVVRYGMDGKETDPVTIPTPPLSFEAAVPPGAEDLEYFFAARDLHLTERFDRRPAALKVGDAFVRTLTIAADGVTAMELPPVAVTTPDGLRLHQDPPVLSKPASGDAPPVPASRVQKITYTTERPGHYTLPAIAVRYWNLADRKIRSASLPAVTFDVESGAAFGEEIALPPDPDAAPAPPPRRSWVRAAGGWIVALAAAAIVFGVTGWIVHRYGPRALRAWRVRRAREAESEAAYFARVTAAARHGDPAALYAAVLAWLARMPGGPALSLALLVAQHGDDALARDVTQLTRSLYASSRGSGRDARFTKRLAAGLARARRKLLAGPARSTTSGGRPLAPLNPSSS